MLKKIILLLFLLLLIIPCFGKNNEDRYSFEWHDYMRNLDYVMVTSWEPPTACKNEFAYITFNIAKNGELISAKITNSSGSKKFDKAVMEITEKAFPFAPVPKGYKGKNLEYTYMFNCEKHFAR